MRYLTKGVVICLFALGGGACAGSGVVGETDDDGFDPASADALTADAAQGQTGDNVEDPSSPGDAGAAPDLGNGDIESSAFLWGELTAGAGEAQSGVQLLQSQVGHAIPPLPTEGGGETQLRWNSPIIPR
jgi:hypothetical protein